MSREDIGYRGYVGKQVNGLSKTATAKKSSTMSAVGEAYRVGGLLLLLLVRLQYPLN